MYIAEFVYLVSLNPDPDAQPDITLKTQDFAPSLTLNMELDLDDQLLTFFMILKVFLDLTLTLTPPGLEIILKLILTLSDFELVPGMILILILTMSHPNFKLTLYFTSNWILNHEPDLNPPWL